MSPRPWPKERIAKLRTLWAAEWSGTDIGKQLGITRNAVLGKLNRLGLLKTRSLTLSQATRRYWSDPQHRATASAKAKLIWAERILKRTAHLVGQ